MRRAIEQHYTRSEVAALLKVTTRTVTRWEVAGKLKANELPGGGKRYAASAIDRMLYAVPAQRRRTA